MKLLRTLLLFTVLLSACAPQGVPIPINMTTSQIGDWTIFTAPAWAKAQVTVSTAAAASDGSLWFGTTGSSDLNAGGAYHFDGTQWTHYSTGNGLPSNEISSILPIKNGSVWFSTTCCGVAQLVGSTWKYYTAKDGLADNNVVASNMAMDETIWFGTAHNGVSRWDGVAWKTFDAHSGPRSNDMLLIKKMPDRNLFFVVNNGGQIMFLRHTKVNWVPFLQVPDELANSRVLDVVILDDGTTWFATENKGVYSFSIDTWTNFTTKDGLASDTVYAITAAPDGSVWFATDKGISRFDGEVWVSFTSKDGLPNEKFTSAAVAEDGSIWFGSTSAIYRYQGVK